MQLNELLIVENILGGWEHDYETVKMIVPDWDEIIWTLNEDAAGRAIVVDIFKLEEMTGKIKKYVELRGGEYYEPDASFDLGNGKFGRQYSLKVMLNILKNQGRRWCEMYYCGNGVNYPEYIYIKGE